MEDLQTQEIDKICHIMADKFRANGLPNATAEIEETPEGVLSCYIYKNDDPTWPHNGYLLQAAKISSGFDRIVETFLESAGFALDKTNCLPQTKVKNND